MKARKVVKSGPRYCPECGRRLVGLIEMCDRCTVAVLVAVGRTEARRVA